MKRISVESILVMFLFIIFTSAIGLLIVEGQESYQNIIDEKAETENQRIGISYVTKKVKQNDFAGNITVNGHKYNDLMAIEVEMMAEEEGYITYIVCYEDGIYEVYQDFGQEMDIEYGELVVKLQNLWSFEFDEVHQLIHIKDQGDIIASVHVMEGVMDDEE